MPRRKIRRKISASTSNGTNLSSSQNQYTSPGPAQFPMEAGLAQHQQMHGPGELVALLSDKIPKENIGQVLEITKTREESREKERQRQFQAFRLHIFIKFLMFFLIVILVAIGIYYLFEIGQSELAEKILYSFISLTAGFLSGWGYASRK